MIYIIKNEVNHCKIGYSKHPQKRIKQLNTGTSSELSIFKTFETKYDSKIEAYLKYFFKYQNIKGEWFDLSSEDIDKVEYLIRIHENALGSLEKPTNLDNIY